MWVFIGVLLVVIVVAAVGWVVVRGGCWLWGSHVRQIERRVNRVKETQKPTLDVEHLRNLNKEEREKKINDFVQHHENRIFMFRTRKTESQIISKKAYMYLRKIQKSHNLGNKHIIIS